MLLCTHLQGMDEVIFLEYSILLQFFLLSFLDCDEGIKSGHIMLEHGDIVVHLTLLLHLTRQLACKESVTVSCMFHGWVADAFLASWSGLLVQSCKLFWAVKNKFYSSSQALL